MRATSFVKVGKLTGPPSLLCGVYLKDPTAGSRAPSLVPMIQSERDRGPGLIFGGRCQTRRLAPAAAAAARTYGDAAIEADDFDDRSIASLRHWCCCCCC